MALAQLFHVFNMRAPAEAVLRNQITRNPFVWAALLICFVLLAVAVFVPPVAGILALQPPSAAGWKLIAIGSIAPVIIGQVALRLAGRLRSAPACSTGKHLESKDA